MVKISILYPNKQGGKFDMDYYLNKHMPMSIAAFSAHEGFKSVSVERGIGGGAPDTDPTYIAMCHFEFDSVESFMSVLSANGSVLQSDVANYTDIESIVQINEIVISR